MLSTAHRNVVVMRRDRPSERDFHSFLIYIYIERVYNFLCNFFFFFLLLSSFLLPLLHSWCLLLLLFSSLPTEFHSQFPQFSYSILSIYLPLCHYILVVFGSFFRVEFVIDWILADRFRFLWAKKRNKTKQNLCCTLK